MNASKRDFEHERALLADPRYARVVARDKSADGAFWYSVATTRIYCRPSCPSRGAKPWNLQFHDTLAEAKATGFRPCKRCNPDSLSADEKNAAIIVKAGRLLEDAEETPSLEELADAASSAKGVAAILLGDDPGALVRDLHDRFPNAEFVGGDARYEALVANVIGFVETPQGRLDLPLDVRGTAFQQRVWKALREVAPGKTATYAEIAERIGTPKSTRAVAGACAANNLAVAIPCHRVVRQDGARSGYRWGVERKQTLLARRPRTMENAIMRALIVLTSNGERGTDKVPYLVEDMLKGNGGRYARGDDWTSFVVVDGNLVTGQNPASSSGVAKELLRLARAAASHGRADAIEGNALR